MKTIEEYLNRNIDLLSQFNDLEKPFGVSFVQRLCRVGYNQACHTIDLAIDRGLIVKQDGYDHLYRFSSPAETM